MFGSRVVGRIAASLFFFSTSFSYLRFLKGQSGFRGSIYAILRATQFISPGYPFRGEDWGVMTVGVFANQRHLISATGILFDVLTFLSWTFGLKWILIFVALSLLPAFHRRLFLALSRM